MPKLKEVLVYALAAILCLPTALLAHAKLIRSDPAEGARLHVPPRQASLVFSEAPELVFSRLRLVFPSSDTVDIGALRHDRDDDHTLVGDLPASMPAGLYRLVWVTAGRDGHPSRGVISFRVLPPATTDTVINDSLPPIGSTRRPPPVDASTMVMAPLDLGSAIARWLSFISIFIVIGVVTFWYGVVRRMSIAGSGLFEEIAASNAATLGAFASLVSIAATAIKAARGMADMPGMPVSSMLFGSMWGGALLLQLAGGVVAAGAFVLAHRYDETRKRSWLIAAVGAVMLAVSESAGGHAVTTANPILSVSADLVHVIAGSMWLGTLAVIVLVGLSASLKTPDTVRPGARVAEMINTFSPIALICGGVVVASGVANSLFHFSSVSALWTSTYGVTLLLKLFFVMMLFVAGAWNWRRMRPRLT
ncbi:MAG: copper resistance protein CopC, partial [Gemmatimonadaceae bacterium]